MAATNNRVYFPTGFQELFSIWNRLHDAVLYAGGTGNIRQSRASAAARPIISLEKLEELKNISRTERYIEIGAMVTLNKIIRLGKIVPEALMRCLEQIEGPQLRNLATIGGNICYPDSKLDITGPMLALDALYELRAEQSSRWITASRFSPTELNTIEGREVLTRVRIPLDSWSYTWYRKFKTSGDGKGGGNILLIMRNQKNILTGIRVLYSGQVILREKNSEAILGGKRLPLDRKDAAAFVEYWRSYLAGINGSENGNSPPEMVKAQILNFIETTILRISE